MTCLDHNGQPIEISQDDMKWLDDDFFAKQQAAIPLDSPRVAMAYRVSSKGQVVQDDIPLQKIECRKFSVRQGWRTVMEKYEKGVSGSKVSATKRDVIQELKAATERHEFDILLVYLFDRLGRIDEETPFLLQWFVKHGVEMWSTREGQQRIDSHTDKLTNYIRFWQASGESEKISERVQTRLKQMNSSGLYTGGAVPFGYRAVHKGRENKRGQPVKDLEIDPTEAPLVREIFEKSAHEGASCYALAQMLNNRGIKTHGGAKFQSTNVLRIIRHEGYTGYIITRSARSNYIPELEIVDAELFKRANEVVNQRCSRNHEARRIAKNSTNPTLLAGLVYCAHCGARMSAFMHRDRYKLSDGSIKVNIKPKYNCYQRGQNVRECDGQALYLAERVDAIVLEVARALFQQIREQPRDRTIEKQIQNRAREQRQAKAELEKRIRDYQHAVERYEDEVIVCLDGHSKFTEEQLSHLLTVSNERLRQAKEEYAQCGMDIQSEREALHQLDGYYNEFQSWADEFDQASLPRKRMILSQLFEKVEVGKGYKVTCYVRMCYQQFIDKTERIEKLEAV